MKSLEKIIKILDYLSDVKRDVGITELSLELNLPKSTVHRILKNLSRYSPDFRTFPPIQNQNSIK